MTVEAMGECGLLLRDLPAPAHHLAALMLSYSLEIQDAVPAYDTLGLYFVGEPPPIEVLHQIACSFTTATLPEPRRHIIPVCYEMGEDLSEVCQRLGIDAEEFARRHCHDCYDCFAIGFCPGFPYLGYLSDELAGLPRKNTPRLRVEAGSVAMTGRQTGIYPLVRPGGWWIVGRTPLEIVDQTSGYFPIRAGDQVKFERIDNAGFVALEGNRL